MELKVAKKTVETAYDILIGEGYLVTRGSRGTVVNPDLVPIAPLAKREAKFRILDDDLASIVKLRETKGEFRLGVPAFDHFPFKTWLLVAGRVMRRMDHQDLLNPPVTGHPPLRDAICSYLNVSRGIRCSPEQIIITSGYKHSLQLILNSLAQSSDKIVFEDPGYIFGQKLLSRVANRLFYNPVDDQGLNVDHLKKHHADAKFVFTAPTHQSPLTVSLSIDRRYELLKWAQQAKSWIIEDDYDGEFHYTKRVIPALKSLDVHDRVIYLGSFSKTIMPSIRTSYIVVPSVTLSSFIETSEITETSQPLLNQKILTSFINDGHFYRHLKKMRILYHERREFVLNALKEVFPGFFEFDQTDGGMQIIANLSRGSNDQELAEIWQAHGLLVYPLSKWFRGKKKKFGLVVGFTNVASQAEAAAAFKKVFNETKDFFGGERKTKIETR